MLGTLCSAIATALPGLPSLAALAAASPVTSPDTGAGEVVTPATILTLCVVAGFATVLLLPSTRRRNDALRKLGGGLLLAAGVILAVLLVGFAAAATAGAGDGERERMGVYFWVFTAVALFGAIRVVTHNRPVYSALYFVLTVFATAGLFVLMWAEFMAAALVLIYAGAILITYVFVIMLAASSRGAEGTNIMAEYDAASREPVVASAVGFALMGVFLFVIFDRAGGLAGPLSRAGGVPTGAPVETELAADIAGATQKLGVNLFQEHILSLELGGLILTLSMVGAILIARRRVLLPAGAGAGADVARADGRESFTAPMTPVDDNPHSIPVYGTDNPRQKAYPET